MDKKLLPLVFMLTGFVGCIEGFEVLNVASSQSTPSRLVYQLNDLTCTLYSRWYSQYSVI